MMKILTYFLAIFLMTQAGVAHAKKAAGLYPLIVETRQCSSHSGGVYRPGPAPEPNCSPMKAKFSLEWDCVEAGKCRHRALKSSDAKGLSSLKLSPGNYKLNLIYPEGSSPGGPCSTNIGPEREVVMGPERKPKRVQLQMSVVCYIPSSAPHPRDQMRDGSNEPESE